MSQTTFINAKKNGLMTGFIAAPPNIKAKIISIKSGAPYPENPSIVGKVIPTLIFNNLSAINYSDKNSIISKKGLNSKLIIRLLLENKVVCVKPINKQRIMTSMS